MKIFNSSIYSIEYLDNSCYQISHEVYGDSFNFPFEPKTDESFYLLLEVENTENFHQKLENFYENNLEIISDMILCQTEDQKASIWAIRENLGEAIMKTGEFMFYDFSLPLTKFQECIGHIAKITQNQVDIVNGFGHIGDGNLHLNLIRKPSEKPNSQSWEDIIQELEPEFMDYVVAQGGSISAEHGIGISKKKYMHFLKSPKVLEALSRLKKVFDPNGILNPGKVL